MNFTKRFLGMLLLLWLFSCQREAVFSDYYIIGIENHYFEMVDSVKVGKYAVKEPILVGETKFLQQKVTAAHYEVVFYTASHLLITARLRAVSHQDTLLLRLTSMGKIQVR